MLQHLTIQNFALIQHYEIHFEKGLSVLTGETGAGKSILLDALGLVLGNRADSKMIRTGEKRCNITAEFDLNHLPSVQTWLNAHALDQDQQCILRRIITQDGKSRAFVNGHTVTLQQLSDLGEQLIDIHGQHEHHYLIKRDHQRALLDEYGRHQPLLDELQKIYEQWQLLAQQKQTLLATDQHQSLKDFLQFQYEEIETLQLQENEVETLEAEYKTLSQAEKFLTHVGETLKILEPGGTSLCHFLGQAKHTLESISPSHQDLTNAFENLSQAQLLLTEAQRDLEHFSYHFQQNPERLTVINERLDLLHRIARKHRITPAALYELRSELQKKLAQLANTDVLLIKIETQQKNLLNQYSDIANKLTKKREQVAKKFSEKVTEKMRLLAMKEGKFFIKLIPLEGMHAYGNEACEYWVQPNPGQAPQALAKIASGGELSRISLAIQVILASHSIIPTLIFDEVDVGIGGATASVVGQLLKSVAQFVQVLCVTHLPQVAAFGDHHYQVQKQIIDQQTHTALTKLEGGTRQEEIARMLGGIRVTPETLATAKVLLKDASVTL